MWFLLLDEKNIIIIIIEHQSSISPYRSDVSLRKSEYSVSALLSHQIPILEVVHEDGIHTGYPGVWTINCHVWASEKRLGSWRYADGVAGRSSYGASACDFCAVQETKQIHSLRGQAAVSWRWHEMLLGFIVAETTDLKRLQPSEKHSTVKEEKCCREFNFVPSYNWKKSTKLNSTPNFFHLARSSFNLLFIFFLCVCAGESGFRYCIISSCRESAVYRVHVALPHRCTILYNTQKARTWNFAVPVPHSEKIRRCILLFSHSYVLLALLQLQRCVLRCSRVEPGIRVSPQWGGWVGFKTGIRVSEDGEWGWGSEIFNLPTKNCFSFLPFSNAHCFSHPVRFQQEKSPKSGKNMGSNCSLASCLAGYASPLSVCTILCTHKRYLATVTLIPGRCFRSRGGGGGVSDFTTIERRSQISVFFRRPLD